MASKLTPRAKHARNLAKLMAAMERCATVRGEADWTNGYRSASSRSEEARLYPKEQAQWREVGRANGAFKRIASKVLRDGKATP